MKKRDILNLIKLHFENDNAGFIEQASMIARDFEKEGDYQLAEYILGLVSNTNVLLPQEFGYNTNFLEKVNIVNDSLFLPEKLEEETLGIINAINSNLRMHKFLFEGAPGTGQRDSDPLRQRQRGGRGPGTVGRRQQHPGRRPGGGGGLCA